MERGTTGIVEADVPRVDRASPRNQSPLALQNADRLIRTIGDVVPCAAIQASGPLLGREGVLRRPAAMSAVAGRTAGQGLP